MALRNRIKALISATDGQDLVEYTLMLGFFVLASAALYIRMSDNIDRLWQGITARLAETGG